MIDKIWTRINANAGEIFYLRMGKPFTYQVEENAIRPNTHKTLIHKGQFEKALEMNLVPADNTKPFQEAKLWGPSYLYAILMDQRIKQTDW
jgi:hypothetical protein